MKTIYITFGQIHTHSVNGITFDKDCVAAIKCDNHGHGRVIAFELFGPRFMTSYDHIDDKLHYYPRGIIEVNP